MTRKSQSPAPAAADSEDRLCTIEDLAAFTFVAVDTSMQKKLGNRAKWLKAADSHYACLLLAAATLEKTSTELDRVGHQVGARAFVDMLKSFDESQGYFEAIVSVLKAASIRSMTTLARMEVSGDLDNPGTGAEIIAFRPAASAPPKPPAQKPDPDKARLQSLRDQLAASVGLDRSQFPPWPA